MHSCVVVSSQSVSKSMLRYIPDGAYVIAADAGWQRAAEIGLAPHLVVGDFDSAPPPLRGEVIYLPAEKDDTDTLFALKEALRRGMDNIILLGALGGREDHSYANLQALLLLAQQGTQNLMADEHTEVRCIGPGSSLVLPAQGGRSLSVFAAGGEARGVCLRGVKYPLEAATLLPGVPLGVSNEFLVTEATISCREGYLYVFICDIK